MTKYRAAAEATVGKRKNKIDAECIKILRIARDLS